MVDSEMIKGISNGERDDQKVLNVHDKEKHFKEQLRTVLQLCCRMVVLKNGRFLPEY